MKQRVRLALSILSLISLGGIWSIPVAVAKTETVETRQLDRTYLHFSGPSRALRKLVNCRIRENGKAARELFDLPSGGEARLAALRAFIGNGTFAQCMTGVADRLSTPNLIGIGTLADELIDIDHVSVPQRASSSEPAVGGGDFLWTWQRLGTALEADQAAVGNCLVAKYPSESSEILATEETSNTERKLLNAMSAEIKDCVPAGQKLILHPIYLRAALATAYYEAARRDLSARPADKES